MSYWDEQVRELKEINERIGVCFERMKTLEELNIVDNRGYARQVRQIALYASNARSLLLVAIDACRTEADHEHKDKIR